MDEGRDSTIETSVVYQRRKRMGTPKLLRSQLRPLGNMEIHQLGILIFMCMFGVFLFVVSILTDW